MRRYQASAGDPRVRVQVLVDVAEFHPVIDKGELKIGHVDTMEWEDVFMR